MPLPEWNSEDVDITEWKWLVKNDRQMYTIKIKPFIMFWWFHVISCRGPTRQRISSLATCHPPSLRNRSVLQQEWLDVLLAASDLKFFQPCPFRGSLWPVCLGASWALSYPKQRIRGLEQIVKNNYIQWDSYLGCWLAACWCVCRTLSTNETNETRLNITLRL